MNPKFVQITRYKGQESGKFRPKPLQKISKQDLDFINAELDWEQEIKMGYTKMEST